jgi:hypothetical protein
MSLALLCRPRVCGVLLLLLELPRTFLLTRCHHDLNKSGRRVAAGCPFVRPFLVC